jgi:SPP1 family predicted phage head-tail adaptor
MIAAGRLLHEIIIEKVTGETQAASGAITPVWTEQETVYAEVKPLHGRNVEIALARTKGKSVSHQVTMRWIEGIDEVNTRFIFKGRILEIFSVLNVLELDIDLDILCNEKRA